MGVAGDVSRPASVAHGDSRLQGVVPRRQLGADYERLAGREFGRHHEHAAGWLDTHATLDQRELGAGAREVVASTAELRSPMIAGEEQRWPLACDRADSVEAQLEGRTFLDREEELLVVVVDMGRSAEGHLVLGEAQLVRGAAEVRAQVETDARSVPLEERKSTHGVRQHR